MYNQIPTRMNTEARARLERTMEGGDDTLTFSKTGEIVLPVEVQQKFPSIALAALSAIREAGGNPDQYVVGSPSGNYNSESGVQQFNWLTSAMDWVTNNRVGQAALTGLGSAAISKVSGASGKQALAAGLGSGLGYYAGDALGDYLSNNKSIRALDADLAANKINQSAYDTQVAAIRNPTPVTSGTVGEAFGNLGGALFENKLAMTGASLGGMAGYALAPSSTPKINVPAFDPNTVSTITQDIPITKAPDVLNTVSKNEVANITATVPDQLPIAPTTMEAFQGINYLTPVRNRDTGRMEYVDDPSPFTRSVNEMTQRRTGFGNRIVI